MEAIQRRLHLDERLIASREELYVVREWSRPLNQCLEKAQLQFCNLRALWQDLSVGRRWCGVDWVADRLSDSTVTVWWIHQARPPADQEIRIRLTTWGHSEFVRADLALLSPDQDKLPKPGACSETTDGRHFHTATPLISAIVFERPPLGVTQVHPLSLSSKCGLAGAV